MNYFEVFGLPRILNIDLHGLEKSFHELSRKYHPDYFSTGTPDEKQQALRMTALLNDAYRTLRQPVRRAEYLVNLEGFKPDGSKVPKSFLMEVFEINEQLDEVKSGAATPEQIQALRTEIEQRANDFMDKINAAMKAWDNLVTSGASEPEKKKQLNEMTEILSEFSYIRNLERDLEESH
jgi:molecular chaperone HscB